MIINAGLIYILFKFVFSSSSSVRQRSIKWAVKLPFSAIKHFKILIFIVILYQINIIQVYIFLSITQHNSWWTETFFQLHEYFLHSRFKLGSHSMNFLSYDNVNILLDTDMLSVFICGGVSHLWRQLETTHRYTSKKCHCAAIHNKIETTANSLQWNPLMESLLSSISVDNLQWIYPICSSWSVEWT